jgi:uncharacterized protein (TIGR01777 family)
MLGKRLVAQLRARGDAVTVFSRDPARARTTLGDVEALTLGEVGAAAFSRLDAVVNLAGEPVGGKRWTPEHKDAVMRSRVEVTRAVADAIGAASPRPTVLVNASAVGFYGPRGDEELGEDEGPGEDFLARVCVAWEREAERAEAHGTRVVRLRVGLVLGEAGGVLEKMIPAFKMFVGGPIGDGRQWVPWVHVDDIVGMIVLALDQGALTGAVNGTAPTPVRFADFAKALGEALGRPSWLPVPGFALRAVMGQMAEAALTGQRAVPRKALAAGYVFRYAGLREALRAVVGRGARER